MIKSISFFSHKLNKSKFNIIKNYAILIRDNKNNLSKFLYDNYKLDLFYNAISKYDFIKNTKNMRQNIGSSFFQQAQMEVYTRYKTQIELLDFKIKNTKLSISIKYLVKTYKDNQTEIIKYLNDSNKKYHKEILNHINKYGNRLFDLVKKIQRKLLHKLKLIKFNSLTFSGINQLSNRQQMIELSELKLSNSVITLNIPKVEKIIIPCRYNQKYHGKLSEYKHSYTKNNQSQISYKCKIEKDKIRIILTKEFPNKNTLKVDNNQIIGIDVNTKNNLFSLSNGYLIKYDKWLMDKYRKYQKYISRVQSTKAKRNLDKKHGKKVLKRINKMNRISKYYADKKANELVMYCKINNINHIVMEDLNIKNKTKAKKDGINYNNIAKVLHLNDYKNIIKRIANRENIMVSYVKPEYTSQTCPICGCIDKKNRKTQETFSCVKCKYTTNADINAANNIKNRIYIKELRDNLEEYVSKDNMYKGKLFISKKRYQELYNKILL